MLIRDHQTLLTQYPFLIPSNDSIDEDREMAKHMKLLMNVMDVLAKQNIHF